MTNFSGPPRTLLKAVTKAEGDKVGGVLPTEDQLTITDEVVASVSGNGKITIQGRDEQLTTTGVSGGQISVGDIVRVGWKLGSPVAVLSHTAQRAKFVPTFGGGVGIVEELYAVETAIDFVEIYFRNADQFVALQYEEGSSPSDNNLSPTSVFWGKGDADFFIVRGFIGGPGGDVGLAVYELNRPEKNEPFPTSFEIIATLVRLYNMTADPATFGTFTLTGTSVGATQSGSISVPLKYETSVSIPAGAAPTDSPFTIVGDSGLTVAGVAPNKDLLVILHVRAVHSGNSGQTDQTFDMGSLLVNVTRTLVIANRLAGTQSSEVYVTPSSTFTCTPLGVVQIDCSVGGSALTAGVITVLSLTGTNPEDLADPTQPGTFNNLLLLGPATVYAESVRVEDPPGTEIGEEFCNPVRATLELSVQGEYASRNLVFATFPGSPLGPLSSQIVFYQGSRTVVLYAPYLERGGLPNPPKMFLRFLPEGVTSEIQNPDPNAVFITGQKRLQAMTASLLFVPNLEEPFNEQFFAEGLDTGSGEADIDMDDLQPITDLEDQAKLVAPDEDDSIQLALAALGGEVQVLESLENLGEFFQEGPL